MKLFFDDVNFDGQLQRTVGKADSGMANVGECLWIAGRIPPGDALTALIAPRGASGEHRLAALVVDPGQYDMGIAIQGRLGDLGSRLDDPTADLAFQDLLHDPSMAGLLAPRMVTNGTPTVRGYCRDMGRYTNRESAAAITCPTYVTDNDADHVSTGQGKVLYEHLTSPKEFRLFTAAEGAEGSL